MMMIADDVGGFVWALNRIGLIFIEFATEMTLHFSSQKLFAGVCCIRLAKQKS